ncbi:ketoacyl-ACP synthase III [Bacillus wiedmannii]|uniref:Beta-ketoacyl-[acyl-carrier-protein] synthase III n=1 Tax=Bacillus wiedmannii TaxID=1890302 RepID=A0AA95RXG6_9BACI|nr:ketoacyl-ACP synthase III [Bacillus wiedmannii]WHY30880.1 ketoacyl-ACP synthase III [Bacillus wiedmannii]
MHSKSRITAIGTYVPNQILSNNDLEKMIDTNDEWIVQRTGMKERRIASEDEYSSHLAITAIENLCTTFKKNLEDIDCIIVATTTADYVFPSVACQIQQHFNIPHTLAFDLNATCAGFTYGLHIGNSLITSGSHEKVLVVATETLSKVTDYSDRTTCILFGDGAGGIHLYRTNLSTTMNGTPLQTNEKIVQNGREVYKWATRTLPAGIIELLHTANMQIDDIDWFIPHSANLRMIESICEKSQIPIQKTLTSVEYMGNTSSVSIPLALDLARKERKLNNGDTLLLYGFGGGLTHLGLIVEWDLN